MMDYCIAAERANDYEYPDEPLQMTITRLRDIIELQAREITRLQGCIRELEREDIEPRRVLLAPGENGHQPAHTDRSVW